MAVLVYAESSNGTLKKAVLEASSYAKDLANKMSTDLHAVVIGNVSDSEINKLGTYGVSTVHKIDNPALADFNEKAYARAIAAVANADHPKSVVMAQSYNGRILAARLAVQLKASLVSGASGPAEVSGDNLTITRGTNSGKGIETVKTNRPTAIITVKGNSFGLKEAPGSPSIENFAFSPIDGDFGAITKETVKMTNKISITEADIVVSGGRGFKGPENWGILETFAELAGAGTACSKPVSDMDWRPHHEHVGQTGIQIAPNLYIAIGISGAIQHLAGVNSSKNIVVINKDPEAPFFKIADYGIVGDLFEVVPQLTEALKNIKATS